MASTTLYPPNLNTITPAFLSSEGQCKIYFTLSDASADVSAIKSVHIAIKKQSNGRSVINPGVDAEHQRFKNNDLIIANVGIGINEIKDEGNGLYSFEILNTDVCNNTIIPYVTGWVNGWIYKFQIRFSSVRYETGEADVDNGINSWCQINHQQFSEWSNYSVVKSISEPMINIPILNYYEGQPTTIDLDKSTLDIQGSFEYPDDQETSEYLYNYSMKLLRGGNVIEETDIKYPDSRNKFTHLFRKELQNGVYTLEFNYQTNNYFQKTITFTLNVAVVYDEISIFAYTIDTVPSDAVEAAAALKEKTTVSYEEDEGRIAIKLYSNTAVDKTGTIIIRRSDNLSNFEDWDDILTINFKNGDDINTLPIYYDYTAEANIFYQYGVQMLVEGKRTSLRTIPNKVIRDYEYSYLVGEDGKQLRLEYNTSISSYKYNYQEGKTDTINGVYPFITRNGHTKYRTFSLNGLLSFIMDCSLWNIEDRMFESDDDIYKYDSDIYKARRRDFYDYKREMNFRESVLAFLQDGRPKLFKSATEGNIVVRLMDVNYNPNQQLNRMIGSFSANVVEVADNSIESYYKYKFCNKAEV